jgi:hypothetical protein
MAGTLTISTLSDGTNSTSSTNCIQGSAKAWVNFNGVTTASIRASYNVSSVTRNSTGNYTINFTNAFSDANYSISGIAGGTSGSFGVTWFQAGSTNTTTSCVMTSAAPSSFAVTDVTGGYLAFFR